MADEGSSEPDDGVSDAGSGTDVNADATTDAETTAADPEVRTDIDPEDGEVVLRLPDSLRTDLKEPFGPVFDDVETLLGVVGTPLVAVGDAVTHHLRTANGDPDVAVVDGYTQRTPVDPAMAVDPGDGPQVPNPAATLTAELLGALANTMDASDPRTIVVAGEEDLVTLAALVAAPDGASVVYGQPGEGMVHVVVDAETRAAARSLFERMDGDVEQAYEILGVDPHS